MNPQAEPAVVKKDHLLESRVIAAIIDVLVLLGHEIIITAVTGGIAVADQSSGASTFTPFSGVSFWLFLLAAMLYYFLQESSTGQTLGKRVMKLRVVAVEGELTRRKVLVRTLLRLIDWLPFLYLLGFILVLVTPQHQRIGDMAASTVVLRA